MTDIALRVELLDTEPLVWRRILVPEQINLRSLHQVIQIGMGWTGGHLYEFVCEGRSYGEPDVFEDFGGEDIAQATNTQLKTLLPRLTKHEFHYIYDFGDNWQHRVVVERSGLENSNPCPRLLDGAMACPPEDIGGPPGYEGLKAVLADEADDADVDVEEADLLLEMVDGDFHPSHFDKDEIAPSFRTMQRGFRRA